MPMKYAIEQNKSDYFKSHDLGLVACLLSKGFDLEKLERSESGRALFILKNSQELEVTVNQFWASSCHVDAHTYFRSLKRLKNQIYSVVK